MVEGGAALVTVWFSAYTVEVDTDAFAHRLSADDTGNVVDPIFVTT